jgi:hypothetical protein
MQSSLSRSNCDCVTPGLLHTETTCVVSQLASAKLVAASVSGPIYFSMADEPFLDFCSEFVMPHGRGDEIGYHEEHPKANECVLENFCFHKMCFLSVGNDFTFCIIFLGLYFVLHFDKQRTRLEPITRSRNFLWRAADDWRTPPEQTLLLDAVDPRLGWRWQCN